MSTVTTGISDDEPYAPGVTMPLAKSMTGVAPPVLVMLPAVPLTDVTVPLPVPAPMAVRKVAASSVETVLSALIRTKVIALGLGSVKKLPPTVVAPSDVRPVAATRLVAPPSHCWRSAYAVSHCVCLAVVGMEYPLA